MNEAEKKIAEALLQRITQITEAGKDTIGITLDAIQTYDAFLQAVERRIGIDQAETFTKLTATGIAEQWAEHAAIEAAETQQYWMESDSVIGGELRFYFGSGLDRTNEVSVRQEDIKAAREWLIAAAPTIQALDAYHQARSFADKWAANKRKEGSAT